MFIEIEEKRLKQIIDALISKVYKQPVTDDYRHGYCAALRDMQHELHEG